MTAEIINQLLPRTAVIRRRTVETRDTFSLELSVNGNDFSFKPGQFNMLGLPGIGEAPFSYSSINEKNRTIIQTIREAGNVVSALKKLNKGETVHFRGPYGRGWPLEKMDGKNVIVVAGGIGMAPLRPVIHYLLENRQRFLDVFVLYGARTQDDMLFMEDMVIWSKKINVFLSADEVTGDAPLKIYEGLVTGLFDRLDVSLPETVTFTCGPQIMMKFVSAGLVLDGQSPGDIYISLERRMKCGIGHCGHCQISSKYVCKDGPVFSLTDIRKYADTLL
jgi:NAD(P)H-flavin reductase